MGRNSDRGYDALDRPPRHMTPPPRFRPHVSVSTLKNPAVLTTGRLTFTISTESFSAHPPTTSAPSPPRLRGPPRYKRIGATTMSESEKSTNYNETDNSAAAARKPANARDHPRLCCLLHSSPRTRQRPRRKPRKAINAIRTQSHIRTLPLTRPMKPGTDRLRSTRACTMIPVK